MKCMVLVLLLTSYSPLYAQQGLVLKNNTHSKKNDELKKMTHHLSDTSLKTNGPRANKNTQTKKTKLPVITELKKDEQAFDPDQIEDRYKLDEQENVHQDFSVLQRDTGFVVFGRHRIDLSGFSTFKSVAVISSLSFPDTITYVGMVKLGYGINRDTIDIKGKKSAVSTRLALKKAQKIRESNPWFAEDTKGFGSDCPPGDCSHYFIAISKSGKLITIDRDGMANKLLPVMKTPMDALFSIRMNDHMSRGKFAKTKKHFLILVNENISHCPIRYADILYQVDVQGHAKVLGKILSQTTTLCY